MKVGGCALGCDLSTSENFDRNGNISNVSGVLDRHHHEGATMVAQRWSVVVMHLIGKVPVNAFFVYQIHVFLNPRRIRPISVGK